MGRRAVELDALWDHYDEVLNRLPDARRKALEAAGKTLNNEVDRQIDRQLPGHDAGGRVKSWQEVTMGTRGGYARVSPMKKTVSASRRSWSHTQETYNSKQITNWLEHGHKMVLPKKAGRGFRRNGNVSERTVISGSTGAHIVPGYLFYSWAEMEAQKLAKKAAEEVLTLLAHDLEDLAAGQITMEGWI